MNYTVCPKPTPRKGERWTHVHEPAPDDEASSPDVFEHVAKLEQLTIDRLNINLQGTEMTATANTTAIAQALTAAGIVAKPAKPARVRRVTPETKAAAAAIAAMKNEYVAEQAAKATKVARKAELDACIVQPGTVGYNNYFDPIDMLEDHLGKYPVIHSKILSSATWMLDMSIINAARNVLFTRYLESERIEGEASKLNEFSLGIVEMISHDSLYGDENQDSPENILAMLITLSDNWHDAAAAVASADNKDYNPKSFDDLLLSEKPRVANVGTRANFEAIAKHEAKGDPVVQARLLASFIEADNLSAIQRSADNRVLIPTLSIIISTVSRYAPADARFDHLPMKSQRALTASILKSFDLAKIDMAKKLGREPIMFGLVLESMYQCTDALNKVLAAKYSDASELESAAVPAAVTSRRRREKAIASSETALAAREALAK